MKTSSKTSWLNVCHILITTVVKFLHENSRQFPLEDHQTTEINNFKNIFLCGKSANLVILRLK
jgi:hypothetical protein